MQVLVSTQENTNISDKFAQDFAEKLKMDSTEGKEEQPELDEGENEDEEEFSFVCLNPDSPIAADEAFSNGQIRPIFPIFDQSLLYEYVNDEGEVKNDSSSSLRPPLRKLFVEERSTNPEAEPAGPFCEWSSAKQAKEASPDSCKKSNSTGFSKLWRFRDLVVRSSSDGKDAFVFLDNSKSEKPEKEKTSENNTTKVEKTSGKNKNEKVKKVKVETVSSMYEKHYLRREGDRRKSYSPYRQDLVGFFTNVNGLSKNVHPY